MPTTCPRAADVVREYSGGRHTRSVVLTLSRDENPKGVVMVFRDGSEVPSLSVKVGLTPISANALRTESQALTRVARLDAGLLDGTVPRVIDLRETSDGAVLVTTACPGTPMLVRYHRWRHTASTEIVGADFDAAGDWLGRLGSLSSSEVVASEWSARLCERWAGDPALDRAARVAWELESKIMVETAPGIMHGDFWCGNALQIGTNITGVVDWEHCTPGGDPLRDRIRFALSYALYLDRHTRAGHWVRGHQYLIAGEWGAGIRHVLTGSCWCSQVIEGFVGDGLVQRQQPRGWWRDALLLGLAEVAVLGDEAAFARRHLYLLADLATLGGCADAERA